MSTLPVGGTSTSREEPDRARRIVLVTPAANYLEIANRWVQALVQAYTDGEEIAAALELAAVDIDELVECDR